MKNLEEYNLIKKHISSFNAMYRKYLPNFKLGLDDNELFSYAYCGQGLLVYNGKGYENKLYNQYDLNSAYPAALCTNVYPISDRYETIELYNNNEEEVRKLLESSLGLLRFSVIEYTKKYNDFYDELFEDNVDLVKYYNCGDTTYKEIFLTSIDALTFLDLFNCKDVQFMEYYKFKDVTDLGWELTERIKFHYNNIHEIKNTDKESAKAIKLAFNICSYGLLVKKDMKMYERFNKMCRSKYVLIGEFEAAYVRRKMCKLYLKYKDHILFMDTDCIVLESSVKFDEPIGNDLGMFKEEFANQVSTFKYVCPKKYFSGDKDGNVIPSKSALSGVK